MYESLKFFRITTMGISTLIFFTLEFQTLASTAAILMTFTAGLTSGYSAILLPQLKSSDTIPCDESTASWIGKYILFFKSMLYSVHSVRNATPKEINIIYYLE